MHSSYCQLCVITNSRCVKEITLYHYNHNEHAHTCDISAQCNVFIIVGGHDTKDIFNPTFIMILRMVTC